MAETSCYNPGETQTLRRWVAKYGCEPVRYGGPGSVALRVSTYGLSDDARWDLHHLDDYAVSSHVSGHAAVLLPRSKRR